MVDYGRGGNFQFVALRADEIADHYEDVGQRTRHLEPAFEEAFLLLEADEIEHFAKLRGRYVLTGQTKESLTRPSAPGAIREVHGSSAAFGTRVLHAHYLTKSPHDPENEQVRKHNGHGRSAVLVGKRDTQRRIAELTAHYVAEPFGGKL